MYEVWYRGDLVGKVNSYEEAEDMLTCRFGLWDSDEAFIEEPEEDE